MAHDDRERDARFGRDRYGRDDAAGGGFGGPGRGPVDRAGDEVRSWFGNDEAARRRRMDEQEQYRRDAEAHSRRLEQDPYRGRTGSPWANERSYSSDREYGDRGYGWRGDTRGYGSTGMTDRDYGYGSTWRSQPAASSFTGTSYGRYDRPDYSGHMEYGREGYGGPYGRERYGAREWSSTEGWRVPGPHAGRGPRGYQRPDDRIREEVNDRLTAHGLIDATDVECRVVNGEVTLTGFVDSRAAKRAAEDLAEDIYGVREVNNQLRVRSHANDEGVGRTSVLGLTEAQMQTTHSPAPNTEPGRPRTRT